ncbi:MAG TPA: CoA-transferase [Bacillota bacterium]|nr:CoA-transferase [Bacillota bacterium]
MGQFESSKIIALEEAVQMVKPGMNLSFSGFANSMCPVGFVRQMIRAGVKEIDISAMGELWAVDMLAGGGAVKRVRQSCFLMEGYGRCRNFSRGAEEGTLAVEDYSHLGITSRFAAAAMGMPFLPLKSMMGTDIEKQRNFDADEKMRVINNPFDEKEKVALVKKLEPDIAVVHCARADKKGNTQLYGITSSTEQIAKSAKKVIVTVEEIVDEAEIRRTQHFTVLPGFFVDAVVHMPFGAHPTGLHKYYDFDKAHIDIYAEAAKTKETFRQYIEEYILDTKNEMEYLSKIGIGHLMSLRVDPHFGISLRNREVL